MNAAGTVRFSTRGVTGERRIELWEHHNERALVGLNARTVEGWTLEAAEVSMRLGDFRIAHVAANAHTVERGDLQIRRAPAAGLAFYFSLHGVAHFSDERGTQVRHPGDLLICDTARPFQRRFEQGVRELVLTGPREVFEEITAHDMPRHPASATFGDHPGVAARLADVIRDALRGVVEPAEAEAETVGLVRALLVPDAVGRAETHRAVALAYIERHLGDPRLGVVAVADAVGVSERHLARIFEPSGQRVVSLILNKRLDLAHRILSAPGAPTIADVAARCGFSSHAHFTRAYGSRFGETPRQTRAH